MKQVTSEARSVAPYLDDAPDTNRSKNFRIPIVGANYSSRVTKSAATFDVGFAQLSKNIQNIQKSGGKILSITEIA